MHDRFAKLDVNAFHRWEKGHACMTSLVCMHNRFPKPDVNARTFALSQIAQDIPEALEPHPYSRHNGKNP
jgi:hypothetical protein